MKIICKAVGNGKQQNQERSILSENTCCKTQAWEIAKRHSHLWEVEIIVIVAMVMLKHIC